MLLLSFCELRKNWLSEVRTVPRVQMKLRLRVNIEVV